MITSEELERIANELDKIADGVAPVHAIRATQIRGCIRKILLIARNEQREAGAAK